MGERYIYKYKLVELDRPRDVVMPAMPAGDVLHVGVQGADLHLWMRADMSQDGRRVTFLIRWTGERVDDSVRHLATFTCWRGRVWHVFLREEP